MLNIDRFMSINDTLGYAGGDAVLIETARRLAALPDVIVGRMHSNQFCPICRQPERGMIPPAKFIPFAEQSGCIRELTNWILQEAMGITRAWRDSGRTLQISVNLSMHDLRHGSFADEMRHLIDDTGADPGDIVLEITESVVMDDPDTTLQVMNCKTQRHSSRSQGRAPRRIGDAPQLHLNQGLHLEFSTQSPQSTYAIWSAGVFRQPRATSSLAVIDLPNNQPCAY